jgi:hypothetical protein
MYIAVYLSFNIYYVYIPCCLVYKHSILPRTNIPLPNACLSCPFFLPCPQLCHGGFGTAVWILPCHTCLAFSAMCPSLCCLSFCYILLFLGAVCPTCMYLLCLPIPATTCTYTMDSHSVFSRLEPFFCRHAMMLVPYMPCLPAYACWSGGQEVGGACACYYLCLPVLACFLHILHRL